MSLIISWAARLENLFRISFIFWGAELGSPGFLFIKDVNFSTNGGFLVPGRRLLWVLKSDAFSCGSLPKKKIEYFELI